MLFTHALGADSLAESVHELDTTHVASADNMQLPVFAQPSALQLINS